LTVPYPAIKITERSASVVGGVASVSSTGCNSPRMQLDCTALHDGRCPWVRPFRRPRVNALWKAAAVTAGSVPDVAVRADREAENPMVGGPIAASTASTKVECAVRVSNPGPAD
jgi:hypothetical protein